MSGASRSPKDSRDYVYWRCGCMVERGPVSLLVCWRDKCACKCPMHDFNISKSLYKFGRRFMR